MNETARILVVDDDATLRRATARVLSKAGYEVIEADGGQAGLRLAQETHPDLMLVDVNMPDMDGNELCRRIKAMPELSDIMVVMLSGTTTDSDSQAGSLEGGADEYIVRSVSPRELVARVSVVLRLKRAQDALRRSEERYRAIAELGSDFAYAVRIEADGSPTPEWVSDSLPRFMGVEPSELARRNPLEFVHPADQARAREWLTALLSNQQPGEIELRLITADGSARWVRTKATAQWDEKQGRITRVVGAAEDITQRKLAEEQSRKLSRAVEQSPTSIVITDLEGKIEYVNPKFTQLTGYTFEEALGQNPRILKSGKMPQSVYEDMWATITAGREWRGELHNKKKNGELYWELASISPITDEMGRITHYIAVKEDITERKKIEQALQASQRLLNMTGQVANIGGWELDAQTLEVRWTEQTYRIHEMPLDYQPPLQEAIAFFHPDDRERLSVAIQRALDYGEPYDMEIRFITATGKHLWTHTICSPVVVNGKTVKLIGSFQDITARKQMEEALRESEERYRSLFENNHAIMLLIDPSDGSIVDANPAAARYYGWTRQELVQKKISDINTLPPDKVKAEMERARREERNQFFFRHRRADGSVHDVEVYSGPILLQGRTLLYSIIHDITARKLAENALRESEQKFRSLVEQSQDGIALTDEQGAIIEWNQAMERITGLPASETRGQPIWEVQFRLGLKDQQTPESYARLEAMIKNVLSTGQAPWLGQLQEREYQHPDGSRRFIQGVVFPIKTERGLMLGSISRDVTAQRQIQDALRESESFMRTVLNAIPNPLFYKDTDGRYLGCNTAFEAYIGRSRDEIVGKTAYDIAPPHLADIYHAADMALFSRPDMPQVYEAQVRYADGSLRDVIFHKAAFYKADGSLAGLVGVVLDITERKQAEAQIRASLQEKEVLLKEIHHRVKNNLQIISSLLRLQADYIHDPAMLAMFRESQERVRTMALIHEKLYQSSDLAHINFGEYARSLATFLYRSYVTDPDRIALEIDTEEICMDINHAVPCGLIVNELVTNALKHAFPPGGSGKISIGARRQDGRYTLTISDTGIGLPPHLDWRNTDSLGMQLVNMLTTQLNGIIEVDTSNGTTFKIVFEA